MCQKTVADQLPRLLRQSLGLPEFQCRAFFQKVVLQKFEGIHRVPLFVLSELKWVP
jgi:hypothetical protein